MEAGTRDEVTRLLRRAGRGEERARERLASLVYRELHARAHAQMRSQDAGHTLQTTALANEAWMRLVDQERVDWSDRAHFFAVATTCIRRLLVDHARRRGAQKRGAGARRVPIEVAESIASPEPEEFLALDAALTRFADVDARKARALELRFFAGLENAQVAEILGVSVGTVERDLRLARAWIARELDRREA